MEFKLVIVVLVISTAICVSCEPNNFRMKQSGSSSVVSLKPLLKLERVFIGILDEYVNKLREKLYIVNNIADKMRKWNKEAMRDPEGYLSNPIHSLALIRRLSADWVNLELFMTEVVGSAELLELEQNLSQIPTSIDMAEAASGLLRLQSTYDMKPLDMAKGLLQDQQFDARLSALDCLTVGEELIKQEKFYFASFWLHAALQIYQSSDFDDILGYNQLKIMEAYVSSLLEQNKFSNALDAIHMALEGYPDNAQLLRQKADTELLILSGDRQVKEPVYPGLELFDLGCRTKFPLMPTLHCRYKSNPTGFLTLAPFKMEEISLDPYLVLFHDVISDREIAEIKKAAEPMLEQTDVGISHVPNASYYRAAHGAWLHVGINNATVRLNQRIADMTGLNLERAEELQVINYGLGGHYTLHYDNDSPYKHTDPIESDDRLATVLFYLSDVEQGGATVFPELKQSIFPRKRSAIHWFNINNRGESDSRTIHGGCPVIVGSKWIANKWINVQNQPFTRPCYPQS